MIGGIDATQGFTPPAGAQGPASRFSQVLQPVAGLLGMSESDLTTELKSGKSLSDIASEKGVSQSDLASTLSQALQSAGNLPQGADPTSLAQQLVQQKGLGGHHHHHHHHGGGSATTTGAPADSSTSATDPATLGLEQGQTVDTLA